MTVSSENAERISLFFEAAKEQGSLVSLNELALLMPEAVSEDEIGDAIKTYPHLRSRFVLESGFVVEKNESSDPNQLLSAERQSRMRASANLRHASNFAPLMQSSGFQMVAVGGSTSYLSASKSKDLDLFCMARSGTMWISLTKSLLLSRVFGLLKGDGPSICISCVMDEGYAKRIFSKDQGALFARDAIQTVVLVGEPAYNRLMSRARWISRFYPTAFASKSATKMADNGSQHTASAWSRAANRFLFAIVGTYISLKSAQLNRRFAASKETESLFNVRKGKDHLVYESRRYAALRNRYSASLGPRESSSGVG